MLGTLGDRIMLGWPLPVRTKKNAERVERDDLSEAVSYGGEGHLITFAPTGSGKGVSAIIPNLLNYSGPIITIDPKGENYAVTASFRRKMGQKVILLDPFHVTSFSAMTNFENTYDSLNPLDLSQSPSSLSSSLDDQATMLATLLAGIDFRSLRDPFWDRSAIRLLSAVIAFVIWESNRNSQTATFPEVIDFISNESGNGIDYNIAQKLDDIGNDMPRFAFDGFTAYLSAPDKETRPSILATLRTYLVSLSSQSVRNSLSSSTLHLSQLVNREDITLYIVIPPNKLVSHSSLLRLWIGTILQAVMERKQRPSRRTLFLLDECAQLGPLEGLRQAVTLLRGYGLQVWMFFQDVSQIESLYPIDFANLAHLIHTLHADEAH